MQPSMSSRYYHQDYFDRRSSNFRHGHESFREAMFQSKTTSLQGKWSNDSFKQEEKPTRNAPLNNWKELYRAIDMDTTPRTENECRKLFQRTHVNIVDLMATKGTGQRVTTYETVDELADYTKDTGKFFPQHHAEAGGLLKFLLRPIHASGTQDEFSDDDYDDDSDFDWDNDYDDENDIEPGDEDGVDWSVENSVGWRDVDSNAWGAEGGVNWDDEDGVNWDDEDGINWDDPGNGVRWDDENEVSWNHVHEVGWDGDHSEGGGWKQVLRR